MPERMTDDTLRVETCCGHHAVKGFFQIHAITGFAPFRWEQPALIDVSFAEVALQFQY